MFEKSTRPYSSKAIAEDPDYGEALRRDRARPSSELAESVDRGLERGARCGGISRRRGAAEEPAERLRASNRHGILVQQKGSRPSRRRGRQRRSSSVPTIPTRSTPAASSALTTVSLSPRFLTCSRPCGWTQATSSITSTFSVRLISSPADYAAAAKAFRERIQLEPEDRPLARLPRRRARPSRRGRTKRSGSGAS